MRRVHRRELLGLAGIGAVSAALAACSDDSDEPEATTGRGGTPVQSGSGSPPTAAGASPTATVRVGADAGAAGLRWFGQAMFLLTSPGGTRVILDPFNNIGYPLPPPLEASAATISHEHSDHNNDKLAATGAQVLRGLTSSGWAQIDQRFGDVRIFAVQSYHDAAQGAQRGRNAVFVYETGGLRCAHLGDLGHQLTADQVRALGGPVDVLMVPVGGSATIDAAGATQLMDALKPKLVFPMHYKTPALTFNLATVDAFLVGKKVQRVGANALRIARDSLPSEPTVAVLDYADAAGGTTY